jgi:hypothetical protein
MCIRIYGRSLTRIVGTTLCSTNCILRKSPTTGAGVRLILDCSSVFPIRTELDPSAASNIAVSSVSMVVVVLQSEAAMGMSAESLSALIFSVEISDFFANNGAGLSSGWGDSSPSSVSGLKGICRFGAMGS